MSLDRLTLGSLFPEALARVSGRRIEKVRPHGPWSLRLELSSRDTLFLDVSGGAAGIWFLPRAARLPADSREPAGPSRTAALLFKKHLEGGRIERLEWAPDRTQTLHTARSVARVRPSGASGASLFLGEESVAHFGGGTHVSAPLLGVHVLDLASATEFIRRIADLPRDEARARLAAADPGLLPLLRNWPREAEEQTRFAEVLSGQRAAVAHIASPAADDAAAAAKPPSLLPFRPHAAGLACETFLAAAAEVYVARRRGSLFRESAQSISSGARAEVLRLRRLVEGLERDRGRWPDPARLRAQAEALLAAPPEFAIAEGGSRVAPGERVTLDVPLPGGGSIEARVDPRRSLAQNADAFYHRARAIERQQSEFDKRLDGVRLDLESAARALDTAAAARRLEDLASPEKADSAAPMKARYLTSRGLEILFGRTAAENHEVTFKRARREDVWFHVLDAPGGHVILRNREGRANREDIAEAAALAAFLSERRTESLVDVQYTERKHVHPAGGGKGRVRVAHAEVIRVPPQDPRGRLRGRS